MDPKTLLSRLFAEFDVSSRENGVVRLSPKQRKRERALSEAIPLEFDLPVSHSFAEEKEKEQDDEVPSRTATPSSMVESISSSSRAHLALDRGSKARKHWRHVRSLVKMSSFTSKIGYQPPPYAPFLSRQLHSFVVKNSLELNRHQNEIGQTQIGAVMFADCSGFTALTERLALQAEMAQAQPDSLCEDEDDASLSSLNGPEELCNIINAFFEKLISTAHVFQLLLLVLFSF